MPRLYLSEIPNTFVSSESDASLPTSRQLDSEWISLQKANYISLLDPSVKAESVPLVLSHMEIPPGVDLEMNVLEAKKKKGSDFLFQWFRQQVQNKGPWDFKQRGRIYEDFGNFHYGVVGRAMGIHPNLLLRAAGSAQKRDKNVNSEWGEPGLLFNPFGGTGSYGDDPHDQEMIKKGMEYYDKVLSKSPR